MSHERWTVVYVGRRFQPEANERSYLYYRVEDGKTTRTLHFKKELLPASPGAILEIDVQVDAEGVSAYANGRTYTGRRWGLTNPNVEVQWAAEDDAHASAANAARNAKQNKFEDALYPIRAAYQQLPGPQRAALLVRVVQYIVGQR